MATKVPQQMQGGAIAFSAYRTSDLAIPNGVFTRVTFTTEMFDTHNWFDVTTGKFTPLIAGKYQLNGFVSLLSVGDQATVHLSIFKNSDGSNIHWTRGRQSGTGEFGLPISTIVDMNGTTDWVSLGVYTAGGASSLGGSQQNCWFDGHFIGI